MEFFRIKKDIPFMSYGKITTSISLVTFILAVFFLATKGLNFGVDFTGGTVIEMHYAQPADLNKVRDHLAGMGLKDALVQNFGSSKDVLIQVPLKQNTSGAKLSEQVLDKLRQQDASVEMRRVEFVGPQVGKELVENGSLALLLVSLGIVCYLWIRFEWKFGLAAIIANLHDVVIILGFFAFFQWEFSLSVLAAVLAVLGYSVNESVVVFDRIRENFRKMRKTEVAEIIDNAITRTMSRTIITHGSTQMMVTAMLFLGGETLHYFALALTIGILFSIYSSVLVASPLLMMFGVSREDFIKPEKTEAEEVLP
ncbi:Protein translocase subunit SecF [Rhodocyclaceae bacterium]|nr:Protein translocase subunit SecF [Rhodocyclaceae bacterium]